MKRAFSLIEIIFVIVILGIIVSFAAPKLMDTKDSALVSTLKKRCKYCYKLYSKLLFIKSEN